MSSIFDYEDQSTYDGDFPIPDDAQFPDDEDMEVGKQKYKVRGDMKVYGFRGNKDAGSSGRHVINLRVGVENNDSYDGAGEVSYWFDADSFEGQWGDIAKRQVASLARLACAMGLIDETAFDGAAPLDAVELVIDATGRFNKDMGYAFTGQLEFVKQKKDDGRVFMNHNLYINKCPKVEAPF